MLARKNDIFGNKDWKVIHTGIKVNLVDLDRMPNAAYTAPLHPHSCNQTSNLLTCTRPSLLSGNCSPASCPSGKWPCRAALSNAPIYWEPKEHLSASSPCQPLSIAVGWPETPSPSSFWQEGPLTMRPTPGQRCAERPPTASVCLDTLWVRHAKGLLKDVGEKPFRTWSYAWLPQQ